MEYEDSVDEDAVYLSDYDQHSESAHQANVRSLLKITSLQDKISDIRASLSRKEKKLEGHRRKVREELTVAKRLGPSHMSPNAVTEIVTFVSLLEEQIRDLRALSTIPVEIDRLRTDLNRTNRQQSLEMRSCPSANSSGHLSMISNLPSEVSHMRQEITEMQAKLTHEIAARTHLETSVIPNLELSKRELEREIAKLRSEISKGKTDISLVSFQDNEPFSKAEELPARSLTPASPATLLRTTGPMTTRAVGKPPKFSSTRGYSPTFLRPVKAKKPLKTKSQYCTPEPPL